MSLAGPGDLLPVEASIAEGRVYRTSIGTAHLP